MVLQSYLKTLYIAALVWLKRGPIRGEVGVGPKHPASCDLKILYAIYSNCKN